MKTFASILAVFSAMASMTSAETPLCPGVYTTAPDVSATSYAAPVPEGYARSFFALNSAVQNPDTYLGFQQLSTYNVSQCAGFCDATNGCRAFNVLAEVKTLEGPAASCNQIFFHCALYSAPVFQDMATNYGQLENRISILSSNGYNADEIVFATELHTKTVTATMHHPTTVTSLSTVFQTSVSTVTVVETFILDDDATTATIVRTALSTVEPASPTRTVVQTTAEVSAIVTVTPSPSGSTLETRVSPSHSSVNPTTTASI